MCLLCNSTKLLICDPKNKRQKKGLNRRKNNKHKIYRIRGNRSYENKRGPTVVPQKKKKQSCRE